MIGTILLNQGNKLARNLQYSKEIIDFIRGVVSRD